MKFGNAAPATGQKKKMVFSIMALGLDPPHLFHANKKMRKTHGRRTARVC